MNNFLIKSLAFVLTCSLISSTDAMKRKADDYLDGQPDAKRQCIQEEKLVTTIEIEPNVPSLQRLALEAALIQPNFALPHDDYTLLTEKAHFIATGQWLVRPRIITVSDLIDSGIMPVRLVTVTGNTTGTVVNTTPYNRELSVTQYCAQIQTTLAALNKTNIARAKGLYQTIVHNLRQLSLPKLRYLFNALDQPSCIKMACRLVAAQSHHVNLDGLDCVNFITNHTNWINGNNQSLETTQVFSQENLQYVLGLLESLFNVRIWALDLPNNQLTHLPSEIGNLIGLRALNLSNNQLQQIPAEIGKLINLQLLELNDNLLTWLPAEIGYLGSLEALGLFNNQLDQLPVEFGNLVNMRTLNLSNNQLTRVPGEIYNFFNLHVLNLSHNQLTQVPAEFGGFDNLETLVLSNNHITQLPAEIGNLGNLQELNMRNNRLTHLPPEIGNLSSLEELSLANNQISRLPSEIGNLISLRDLGLSRNRLNELPREIGRLGNLEELNLARNQLTHLPVEIGNAGTLNELYLSRNQLTHLPEELGNIQNITIYLGTNDNVEVPQQLLERVVRN